MTFAKRVLLTGATGFIGKVLCDHLRGLNYEVITTSTSVNAISGHRIVSFDEKTDWTELLIGVDLIIHLAARVPSLGEKATDAAAYQQTNVEGTLNFARQAASAQVKRFVFISSIKVNGEKTTAGQAFTAEDAPAPEDIYGASKAAAEQGLLALAENADMDVVIIRPPLVYGPAVKGNFAAMIKLVRRGLPLPLGAINNQRSLVSIDNLISLIVTCLDHPAASNQIFLVSDGEDLSTSDLLRRLAQATGASPRLIPLPEAWLSLMLQVLGKQMLAQRVLGSLQVDITKTRNLLGWQPPLTVNQGLQRCLSSKAEL